jgi:hypothetical protein
MIVSMMPALPLVASASADPVFLNNEERAISLNALLGGVPYNLATEVYGFEIHIGQEGTGNFQVAFTLNGQLTGGGWTGGHRNIRADAGFTLTPTPDEHGGFQKSNHFTDGEMKVLNTQPLWMHSNADGTPTGDTYSGNFQFEIQNTGRAQYSFVDNIWVSEFYFLDSVGERLGPALINFSPLLEDDDLFFVMGPGRSTLLPAFNHDLGEANRKGWDNNAVSVETLNNSEYLVFELDKMPVGGINLYVQGNGLDWAQRNTALGDLDIRQVDDRIFVVFPFAEMYSNVTLPTTEWHQVGAAYWGTGSGVWNDLGFVQAWFNNPITDCVSPKAPTVVWELEFDRLAVTSSESATAGELRSIGAPANAYRPGVRVTSSNTGFLSVNTSDETFTWGPTDGANRTLNIETGTAVGGTSTASARTDAEGFSAEVGGEYRIDFKALSTEAVQLGVRGNGLPAVGGNTWTNFNLTTSDPAQPFSYSWKHLAGGGDVRFNFVASGSQATFSEMRIYQTNIPCTLCAVCRWSCQDPQPNTMDWVINTDDFNTGVTGVTSINTSYGSGNFNALKFDLSDLDAADVPSTGLVLNITLNNEVAGTMRLLAWTDLSKPDDTEIITGSNVIPASVVRSAATYNTAGTEAGDILTITIPRAFFVVGSETANILYLTATTSSADIEMATVGNHRPNNLPRFDLASAVLASVSDCGACPGCWDCLECEDTGFKSLDVCCDEDGCKAAHDKSGAAATCTTPQICAVLSCGVEIADALGHDDSGAAATCESAQICARAGCDHEVAPKLEHPWGLNGEDCRACTVCPATQTSLPEVRYCTTVPKCDACRLLCAPHTYVDECSEDEPVCEDCGNENTLKCVGIPAKAGDWCDECQKTCTHAYNDDDCAIECTICGADGVPCPDDNLAQFPKCANCQAECLADDGHSFWEDGEDRTCFWDEEYCESCGAENEVAAGVIYECGICISCLCDHFIEATWSSLPEEGQDKSVEEIYMEMHDEKTSSLITALARMQGREVQTCHYGSYIVMVCLDECGRGRYVQTAPPLGPDTSGPEATCVSNKICARVPCNCENPELVPIVKDAHDMALVATVVTPATCEKEGTNVYECLNDCGHTAPADNTPVNPLNHIFDETVASPTSLPNCMVPGTNVFKCSNEACDATTPAPPTPTNDNHDFPVGGCEDECLREGCTVKSPKCNDCDECNPPFACDCAKYNLGPISHVHAAGQKGWALSGFALENLNAATYLILELDARIVHAELHGMGGSDIILQFGGWSQTAITPGWTSIGVLATLNNDLRNVSFDDETETITLRITLAQLTGYMATFPAGNLLFQFGSSWEDALIKSARFCFEGSTAPVPPRAVVSFNLNGGTSAAINPITVGENNRIATAPTAPTREFHRFLGWSLTIDGALVNLATQTFALATTPTLFAQWEFICQAPKLTEVWAPVFSGYTIENPAGSGRILGLGIHANSSSSTVAMVDGNLHLINVNSTSQRVWEIYTGLGATHASWVAATSFNAVAGKQYKIEFDIRTLAGTGTFFLNANENAVRPINNTAVTTEWQTLSGTWTQASGQVRPHMATPTAAGDTFVIRNLKIYEVGEDCGACPACTVPATTFTVNFDANRGTGTGTGTMAAQEITRDTATPLRPNTFTNGDFTFIGWATTANATTPAFGDGEAVTNLAAAGGSVTLFAVWAASDAKFTVTFNANGGTGTMAPQEMSAGEALSANTFTNEGFQFLGWATSATGGVVYLDGSTSVSFARSLYAVWLSNEVPIFNISFNTGGGSAQSAIPTGAGGTLTMAVANPTLTNHEFVGWALANGTPIANIATHVFAADTTVYAVWALIKTGDCINDWCIVIDCDCTVCDEDGICSHCGGTGGGNGGCDDCGDCEDCNSNGGGNGDGPMWSAVFNSALVTHLMTAGNAGGSAVGGILRAGDPTEAAAAYRDNFFTLEGSSLVVGQRPASDGWRSIDVYLGDLDLKEGGQYRMTVVGQTTGTEVFRFHFPLDGAGGRWNTADVNGTATGGSITFTNALTAAELGSAAHDSGGYRIRVRTSGAGSYRIDSIIIEDISAAAASVSEIVPISAGCNDCRLILTSQYLNGAPNNEGFEILTNDTDGASNDLTVARLRDAIALVIECNPTAAGLAQDIQLIWGGNGNAPGDWWNQKDFVVNAVFADGQIVLPFAEMTQRAAFLTSTSTNMKVMVRVWGAYNSLNATSMYLLFDENCDCGEGGGNGNGNGNGGDCDYCDDCECEFMTIKFDLKGGTRDGAAQFAQANRDVLDAQLAIAPTRADGAVFKGWSETDGGAIIPATWRAFAEYNAAGEVTKDEVTLFAVWETGGAKADRAAPTAAPTMASATSSRITLVEVTGMQYRRGSDGAWQDSAVFSGLAANTEYRFYMRYAETATHNASPAGPGAPFRTERASTGGNTGGGTTGGGDGTTVTPGTVVSTPVVSGGAITLPANFAISTALVAQARGEGLLPAATIRATAAGRQTVNFGTAANVAGQSAILVRVNPTSGELEVVSAVTINADGTASVNVPAAGDYLVIARKIGDVTGTGDVTTADALALLRHIAGIETLDAVQLFAANGQIGDCGTTDALNILRYIAGIIDSI